MVRFNAIIKRFASQGEKTGWTYIDVNPEIAQKLKPGKRTSFRVKGRMDGVAFCLCALMPMGEGAFIMTLNAPFRKKLKKQVGVTVKVEMELDAGKIEPPPEFLECLKEEPEAFAYFNSLPEGHRNYFSNWIRSAKTEPTQSKRIAMAINAFLKKWDFGQMVRAARKDNGGLREHHL